MIIGLGNPGKKYERTRHNVGFEVVDRLAGKIGVDVSKKKFGGLLGEGFFEDKKLILLKPAMYMNLSGQVAATARGFYHLEIDDLIVITDDMALDVGRIRLRTKGSSGGHNGLKDIIEKFGSQEFTRLRIGIGENKFPDSRDYVLSRFDSGEMEIMDRVFDRSVEAVLCWLREGPQAAMTKFNGSVEE
jgi:PTH1 family peptidyl-tRNA hydrolase